MVKQEINVQNLKHTFGYFQNLVRKAHLYQFTWLNQTPFSLLNYSVPTCFFSVPAILISVDHIVHFNIDLVETTVDSLCNK